MSEILYKLSDIDFCYCNQDTCDSIQKCKYSVPCYDIHMKNKLSERSIRYQESKERRCDNVPV
jgi:hypothetical protein